MSEPSAELVQRANEALDRLEKAAAECNREVAYEILDEIRDLIAINPVLLMMRRISTWYESKGTQVLLNSWHLDRQKRTIQSLN